MINNHSILINPKTCQKHVFTAGSEVLEATAVGDINISTAHGDVFLQNVLYVRNLNVNLLSTNSLTDEGAQVILDHTGVTGLNAPEAGRSVDSYEGSAGIKELGRS